MAEEKDNVPLKTHGVADEPIPLMVIPSKVWTQPYGTELYDWVATEVLGTRSKVTKEAGEVPDWLWVYDYLFTRVRIRIPLTLFQQEVIRRGAVAPSQLHPNSWAFIRSFELVCQALGLPGFLSFRAHGKMKIFDFFDESSNFKEIYFKISGAPEIQPFYLTSEKKAKFSLYWRMGYRSPRPGANVLSEEEKKVVSLLRSVWG
ncbi:hypothetical protein PIB30_073247 [Stylosanthes scabra]|uniref:Uncharacterized protein n=1 Tax=Stylosanthes scabra TaxID=79078 RepID=A0ABU6YPP2_9FABA|nr:hypothetical protein [Stylosanthes scabra]